MDDCEEHLFPKLRLKIRPNLVSLAGGTRELPITDPEVKFAKTRPDLQLLPQDAGMPTFRSNNTALLCDALSYRILACTLYTDGLEQVGVFAGESEAAEPYRMARDAQKSCQASKFGQELEGRWNQSIRQHSTGRP